MAGHSGSSWLIWILRPALSSSSLRVGAEAVRAHRYLLNVLLIPLLTAACGPVHLGTERRGGKPGRGWQANVRMFSCPVFQLLQDIWVSTLPLAFLWPMWKGVSNQITESKERVWRRASGRCGGPSGRSLGRLGLGQAVSI